MRKKRLTLQEKAFMALKAAVRKVIEHHKQTGRPLAIWRNGRVANISASQALRSLNKKIPQKYKNS